MDAWKEFVFGTVLGSIIMVPIGRWLVTDKIIDRLFRRRENQKLEELATKRLQLLERQLEELQLFSTRNHSGNLHLDARLAEVASLLQSIHNDLAKG